MSTIAGQGIASDDDIAQWRREPLKPGLAAAELEAVMQQRFALARDAKHRWNLAFVLPSTERGRLRDIIRALRDDATLRFDCLLDVTAIDYLSYPNHRGPRFAIVYVLKSMVFRHRLHLKVEVEEDDAAVPSIHDLYRIADWAEREAWDQVGVVFTGHPNLKRLLNHHEFIGHPLRKDYPCQKRQKLSINDPMVDQLEARLREFGYSVLDSGEVHLGEPIAAPHQSAAEQGAGPDPKKHAHGAIGAGGL
jgi:NADH-quinone oxidoreductase subunit C